MFLLRPEWPEAKGRSLVLMFLLRPEWPEAKGRSLVCDVVVIATGMA
jgi:hypothetical protein